MPMRCSWRPSAWRRRDRYPWLRSYLLPYQQILVDPAFSVSEKLKLLAADPMAVTQAIYLAVFVAMLALGFPPAPFAITVAVFVLVLHRLDRNGFPLAAVWAASARALALHGHADARCFDGPTRARARIFYAL